MTTADQLPTPGTPEPSLPEQMSDLLERAVADARGLDRSYYRLEHGVWAVNIRDQGAPVCQVCLAGAVMVTSLGADAPLRRRGVGAALEPEDFEGAAMHKLYALDYLRLGLLGAAADQLDLALPDPEALEALERQIRSEMEWWEDEAGFRRAPPWRFRHQEDGGTAALDWYDGLARRLRAIGA